jgi:hypothetical protein
LKLSFVLLIITCANVPGLGRPNLPVLVIVGSGGVNDHDVVRRFAADVGRHGTQVVFVVVVSADLGSGQVRTGQLFSQLTASRVRQAHHDPLDRVHARPQIVPDMIQKIDENKGTTLVKI